MYDLTDYVDDHPGGREILWKHNGSDATRAFASVPAHKITQGLIDKSVVNVGIQWALHLPSIFDFPLWLSFMSETTGCSPA